MTDIIPLRDAHLLAPETARNFIFAGNALFTLKNRASGNHMTFKVRLNAGRGVYWVSADETLLGWIEQGRTRLTASRRAPPEAARKVQAAEWLFNRLAETGRVPEPFEIWHEGQCGKCGRALTDPTSIVLGIGPICRQDRN